MLAGRAQRQSAAKQLRDRKRSESLAQRRSVGPPTVVAFLPLSQDMDFPPLWQLVLSAYAGPAGKPDDAPAKAAKAGGVQRMDEDSRVPHGAHAMLATQQRAPRSRSVIGPCPINSSRKATEEPEVD